MRRVTKANIEQSLKEIVGGTGRVIVRGYHNHGIWKKIEFFLVNGTADSIITAELSNWNGKAIKIPRIEVPTCKRDDICGAGVYFLFCKEDDGSDSVYIGEAENIKERLVQHIRDNQADKEKYYWNTTVLFTGSDLNKALIRYLENRLVEIARNSKRYAVLTKNTYKNTVIKESQVAAMEEFIENIKILINALGYKVLEPIVVKPVSGSSSDVSEEYSLSIGTATATGVVTSEGFVVYKGAVINSTPARSISPGALNLRNQLIAEGKVKNWNTTEDILFSSSSLAAGFVLGYSASGPKNWRTKDGTTLKEIEENKTASI